MLATLVLAVFDKIDLATLEHEGITYESIGYLMLSANTVIPTISLVSGLIVDGRRELKESVVTDLGDEPDEEGREGSVSNPVLAATDQILNVGGQGGDNIVQTRSGEVDAELQS